MEDHAVEILFILLAFSPVLVYFIYVFFDNRRDLKGVEEGVTTCSTYLSDYSIDPSAVGGIVRMPKNPDPRSTMGSATSGLMYRRRGERLLPAEGFGRKRALRVMISIDESLNGKRPVVSGEDARKLRMDKGYRVTLEWTERRPPVMVRYHAYRGKVLGIPSREVVQEHGPHKVRVSSRAGERAPEEEPLDEEW